MLCGELWPVALTGGLLWLIGLRALAVAGLKKLARGEGRSLRGKGTVRQTSVRPNASPLLARELARQARRSSSWGRAASFLLQLAPALAGLAYVGEALGGPWLTYLAYPLFLGYLALTWTLCSLNTLELVNSEREQGTWEMLLASQMTAEDLVRGSVEVAIVPFRGWFLSPLMLVPFVCFIDRALVWSPQPCVAVVATIWMIAMVWGAAVLAALTGIGVAIRSRTAEAARANLGGATVLGAAQALAVLAGLELFTQLLERGGWVHLTDSGLQSWTTWLGLPLFLLGLLEIYQIRASWKRAVATLGAAGDAEPEAVAGGLVRPFVLTSSLCVVAMIALRAYGNGGYWAIQWGGIVDGCIVWVVTVGLLDRLLNCLGLSIRPARLTHGRGWVLSGLVGALSALLTARVPAFVDWLTWLFTGQSGLEHRFERLANDGSSPVAVGALSAVLVYAYLTQRDQMPDRTSLLGRECLRSLALATIVVFTGYLFLRLTFHESLHPSVARWLHNGEDRLNRSEGMMPAELNAALLDLNQSLAPGQEAPVGRERLFLATEERMLRQGICPDERVRDTRARLEAIDQSLKKLIPEARREMARRAARNIQATNPLASTNWAPDFWLEAQTSFAINLLDDWANRTSLDQPSFGENPRPCMWFGLAQGRGSRLELADLARARGQMDLLLHVLDVRLGVAAETSPAVGRNVAPRASAGAWTTYCLTGSGYYVTIPVPHRFQLVPVREPVLRPSNYLRCPPVMRMDHPERVLRP